MATVSKKAKKKVVKQVATGRMYIQATYNNTLITATDQNGNTLAWSSSGNCGFRGAKKATPFAATTIVKTITDRLKEVGLKDVAVFVRGVGNGRDAALRALQAQGFNVLSIKDTTPLPHNGCRAPKPRRI